MNNTSKQVKLICVAAVFMAANIALSSFGVPVPGGHFYLNDIVICTGALLLPTSYAVIAGAFGSFLGDLFFYPAPMYVSLVTRALQCLAICLILKALKGKENGLPKLKAAIIAVIVGALIMVAGYTFGRAYIYATPQKAILKLPFQFLQAGVGAVVSVILCCNTVVGKIYRKSFA